MAYRYQTPRSQQYQSTFVPLPLDYLNQAMLSRQQSYDQNYQNMMAAEDKYAALETAPGDNPYKTKILDEAFGNIQKTVQDKYGGDYSQATNEIMNSIVGLRKNPFWNYSQQHLTDWKQKKQLYDKLQAEGKLVAPEGFNMNQSVYDEQTGTFRLPQYNMYERNDYNKYFESTYKGLQNEVTEGPLTGSMSQDNPFLSRTTSKGYDRNELMQKINASDIENFKRENPTFKIEYPNATDEQIKSFIVNGVDNLIAKQTTSQDVHNPNFASQLQRANFASDEAYRAAMLSAKQNELKQSGFNLDLLQREGFLPYVDTNYEDLANEPILQGQLDKKVKDLSNKNSAYQFNDFKSMAIRKQELEALSKSYEKERNIAGGKLSETSRNALQTIQSELNQIEQIGESLKTDFEVRKNTGIPKFDISPMATSDPKLIPQIDNIRKVVVNNFSQNLNGFTSTSGNKDINKLLNQGGIDLKEVNGFSFDTKGGFILDAVVDTENEKGKKITLAMKQSALDINNDAYWNTLRYLTNYSAIATAVYNKNIEEVKKIYEQQQSK